MRMLKHETLSFWRAFALALIAVAGPTSGPANANNWEKFYTSWGQDDLLPSAVPPEIVPSSGDPEKDMETMWRRGFAPIGITSFNTNNNKTKDAVKFAAKLKARFLIVATQLTSSNTSSVPLTLPSTTTSQTSGNATVFGSGGSATGTYSGTTTTYGTSTTYIPITVNRFDKTAVYFKEVPRVGTGILTRELSTDKMSRLDTRRAFVVRWVRDGSPAYRADIFPGDIITHVDGQPADFETWTAAVKARGTVVARLFRNGQQRDVVINISPEWRGR